MSQSGATNNQYQFTGEQLDGELGDYYLVNGKIYSFPDDYSTRINPKIPGILNPSLYIPKEQEDYLYEFHRYSLNYSSVEKRQLIASLETSLSSKYSNTQNYAAGFPLTLSHALNCTTFVAENLPSKGGLFNALVKSNYIPYGLGWGLDQMDRISRGYNVKKLTTLSRPI